MRGPLTYLRGMLPKIVICASGQGTNFEAIVSACREGRLKAEVTGLLSNRRAIGAIGRAKLLGIPHKVLLPRDFRDRAEWDQAMTAQATEWGADWIVLAGFLALIGPKFLQRFPNRIVNSHPALLPKFGGEGMYGDRVHEAVIQAGELQTGITIHLIDGEYDRGKILAQERVEVVPGDTAAHLAQRLKAREIVFYPKVLNDLVTGRITTG